MSGFILPFHMSVELHPHPRTHILTLMSSLSYHVLSLIPSSSCPLPHSLTLMAAPSCPFPHSPDLTLIPSPSCPCPLPHVITLIPSPSCPHPHVLTLVPSPPCSCPHPHVITLMPSPSCPRPHALSVVTSPHHTHAQLTMTTLPQASMPKYTCPPKYPSFMHTQTPIPKHPYPCQLSSTHDHAHAQ